MKTIVLLCLLGLLAASLAEEQVAVDSVQVRELTEVGHDIDAGLASYEDVMYRQKRHLRDLLCGICHPKPGIPIEPPCHERKWVSYQKKSKCGFWRRRHTCYKTRHHFEVTKYCCDKGKLFPISSNLHVCVSKLLPGTCGGFFVFGPKYGVCKFGHLKFCSPRYQKNGDYCYKKDDLLCGICHPKPGILIEPPCHKLKSVSYQKKSKCGWWRRRHTCYKTRHRLEMTKYCCDQGKLFQISRHLHVCINKHSPGICGGFFASGPKYNVCKFGVFKFCSPLYNKSGDYCYKK